MYKNWYTTSTTELTPLVYNTLTAFMFVDNMELIKMDHQKDTHLDMVVEYLKEGIREWQ